MADAIDVVQRRIIVKEIYEKSGGDDYRDVRTLYTTKAIRRRLAIIERLVQQAQSGSRAHLLHDNERQLLETKLAIYLNSPSVPQCGPSPYEVLRLTDVQPEDEPLLDEAESLKRKKAHTIVLLHHLFIHHTYDELVALRDSPAVV